MSTTIPTTAITADPIAISRRDFLLEPDDAHRLANLNGSFDSHLRSLEVGLGIEIRNRGNRYVVIGPVEEAEAGEAALQSLYALTEDVAVDAEHVHLALREFSPRSKLTAVPGARNGDDVVIRTKRGVVRGRSPLQKAYLEDIANNVLSFGIGPAGTGKTYLAVASAVEALERDRVRKLVLVRPAVEAGEKLGFLPGDMAQKIDPYLRPLYDALYEMLGFEKVARLIERNVIEVAPLAFMRGRTLNEAFVILDEAQNTTVEQMKMFLTRLGFGSVAVVTGDVTQIDLPKHVASGLTHAMNVLRGVQEIGFTHFGSSDVVRHPLVQTIVRAYEAYEASEKVAPGFR
ncbi:PhoH family protein [Nevskia sp.]|uniref:PhoH family protein n=1 Tax=Nevskia sp. TaxID=1929292 RepID=UPI0025D46D82|nr:PhoH family protein [Nevskia sp.]